MSPEDIKKLLGGYATGTLTAEEQQALFAAALEDQELFDALAREQSLCDLLRDPAARAELLSALDAPAGGAAGFWQWLRRPAFVGLAMAGVAAIAVVAVWREARVASPRPAAAVVAELKRQEPAPAPPHAAVPSPAESPEVGQRSKVADAPAAAMADKKAVAVMAPPPAAPAQIAETGAALMKDNTAAPSMATPPPPPAPAAAPALMARKEEADAPGKAAVAVTGRITENVVIDARALFYADQLAPAANAFVPPGSGGGGAAPLGRTLATRRDAVAQTAAAAAPRLGVRVSILRGAREVDLATGLDPGEAVRLRVTPNTDGFLYVVEGSRTVASGAAQRLQPFETPELRFEGSGPKQLYVMLSRRPQTVDPQSLGSFAGGNVTGSSAGATYVVSGLREGGAQQVVVPVTLRYR